MQPNSTQAVNASHKEMYAHQILLFVVLIFIFFISVLTIQMYLRILIVLVVVKGGNLVILKLENLLEEANLAMFIWHVRRRASTLWH